MCGEALHEKSPIRYSLGIKESSGFRKIDEFIQIRLARTEPGQPIIISIILPKLSQHVMRPLIP
jgi:hypothetical protein